MKIKKLATIVNRAKQLYLYDSASGRQWAGIGSALYLLPENLPKMDTEQLTGIMDIKPQKAAEFFIETGETPATMPDGDTAPDETELLYDLTRGIIWDGADILPLQTPGGGIYYIPFKQLDPVNDAEQPGYKILDTHLGSGSSRIAAYDAGIDFTGFEIHKGYFDLQEARFQQHTAQTNLFLDSF